MFKLLKKRYDFNNGRHYILTDCELSNEETTILSKILLSFPHGSYDNEWPILFENLTLVGVPLKLQKLAANAYDSFGQTVLGVTAEYAKSIPAMQKLISLGADLNATDQNMKTSVIYWAIGNHVSLCNRDSVEAVAVLKCLLDNGANTTLISCYANMTPLEYADNMRLTAAAEMLRLHMSKEYTPH